MQARTNIFKARTRLRAGGVCGDTDTNCVALYLGQVAVNEDGCG